MNWLAPSQTLIQQQAGVLLPVVRHVNDLAAVVSAVEAQPDWVLSTNDARWGPALASRTELRIATPQSFLELVSRRFVAG